MIICSLILREFRHKREAFLTINHDLYVLHLIDIFSGYRFEIDDENNGV